jgi:hypothetical protein
MYERCDKSSIANRTLLAWIIGSLTSSMSSSFAYSLETEEPITVNKVRSQPQPWVRFSTGNLSTLLFIIVYIDWAGDGSMNRHELALHRKSSHRPQLIKN